MNTTISNGILNLLQTELFDKLHAGVKKIDLPFYDRENDRIVRQEKVLGARQIVLIEGIFLQRKEWESYFDFVIYIDCPLQERKKRVLNRDSYIGSYSDRLSKYERRYWVAEEYYLNTENPFAKADAIYKPTLS